MSTPTMPLNLMIAHAGQSRWAMVLVRSLAPLPLKVHWPRNGDEAIGLAARRGMHLAVVDDELPDAGGRGALRGIRRLGLALPCLLVCHGADQRLLRDAIQLDVFSVVEAESERDLLTPTVLKAVRQVYHLDWLVPGTFN